MIFKCRYHKTLCPHIPGRGTKGSVGIYLPTEREYTDVDDKSLKHAMKEIRGGWNKSSLFLSALPQATSMTSVTGKMRKSVVKIPRSKVAPQLLTKLDCCN